MVNRRCAPEINYDCDLRYLKIKFDSTQLSGFRNWKITELDSNKVILTFDKDSNTYVSMGEFLPVKASSTKSHP